MGMDVEARPHNLTDVDPNTGHPWSSGGLEECLRQGADRFGWAGRDPRPGVRREGNWLIGTGMATAGGAGETYGDLMRRHLTNDTEAIGSWDPPPLDTPHGLLTFGARFAEVAVDADLGLGRWANASLGDYLVPVNADAPDLDIVLIEVDDPVTGPLGGKGVGEIGQVGSGAAIANAVHHATGHRVRELPITVERLLAGPPA